jgi:hypothetical protein
MNRVSHTTHAIAELQSKKIEILDGAGADTDIAITGIAVGDTIGSAIEYVAGVPTTDRTATTAVTSAGNIQCSAATTGNVLLVEWYNKNAL